MIARIFTIDELSLLPEKGIEAQKIRALFTAYGSDYDFCRFFRQGSSYISALDGSFVLCDSPDADFDEIADFLLMSGFADIFCSEPAGSALADRLELKPHIVSLMRWDSSTETCPEPCSSTPLSEVYSIIREGFDIEFEPWYLDMSHRVRHGVTRCFTSSDKAALVMQHNLNGEVLLSQVACRKAHRGQGIASQLVKAAAASLQPSEVYVICEDALVPFYKKCGFVPAGKNIILTRGD